jgi:hypothetical protein
MKKISTILMSFVAGTLLISSCSTNKIMTIDKDQLKKELTNTSSTSFVKKKDGTIVFYNSLDLKKGVFTSPHLLANGKIKIMPSEIVSYQNQDQYAVSQNTFSNGRKSFVAVKTLPGFGVRVVKGKLNIYCKQYFNGRAAIDEFYIQAGNEGKIYLYSPELMKELIRDNNVALNYFNQIEDLNDYSKKLQTTAEIFNNGMLMSKISYRIN